jgi:hypothetical protein
MKNTKAHIIMLNGEIKRIVIGVRSSVPPILSKMRTTHLKETMGDASRNSRMSYNNLYLWHVETTECTIMGELKVERGKNRVDRR